MKIEKFVTKELSRLEDDHYSKSLKTPLKKGAFKISDIEKIKLIEVKVREILDILGMDLKDDSIAGTPKRVAKMFINEIFSGLNPLNKPNSSTFKNSYKYDEMLVEKSKNEIKLIKINLINNFIKTFVVIIMAKRRPILI